MHIDIEYDRYKQTSAFSNLEKFSFSKNGSKEFFDSINFVETWQKNSNYYLVNFKNDEYEHTNFSSLSISNSYINGFFSLFELAQHINIEITSSYFSHFKNRLLEVTKAGKIKIESSTFYGFENEVVTLSALEDRIKTSKSKTLEIFDCLFKNNRGECIFFNFDKRESNFVEIDSIKIENCNFVQNSDNCISTLCGNVEIQIQNNTFIKNVGISVFCRYSDKVLIQSNNFLKNKGAVLVFYESFSNVTKNEFNSNLWDIKIKNSIDAKFSQKIFQIYENLFKNCSHESLTLEGPVLNLVEIKRCIFEKNKTAIKIGQLQSTQEQIKKLKLFRVKIKYSIFKENEISLSFFKIFYKISIKNCEFENSKKDDLKIDTEGKRSFPCIIIDKALQKKLKIDFPKENDKFTFIRYKEFKSKCNLI